MGIKGTAHSIVGLCATIAGVGVVLIDFGLLKIHQPEAQLLLLFDGTDRLPSFTGSVPVLHPSCAHSTDLSTRSGGFEVRR